MQQKLSKQIGWFAALMVTALVGGCATPVKSFEPLVDKTHAVSDAEVVGKWVYPGESELYQVEIKALENVPNTYSVTFKCCGGKSEYRAELGRWGKEEFADVESLSVPGALGSEANPLVVPTHSFCRVRREHDVLRLALMDSDWAKEHLPEEKQRKTTGWEFGEDETGIVFTGSTEELQEFVLQNAADDKAFVEFRFAREGTLAAYSQLLEVGYEGAARLYAEQRDYEQAAIAWTRYLETEPKDPDAHEDLGLALLGNNNAGRAREEFLERTRLCKHVPPPGHRLWDFDTQWCEKETPELAAFRQGVTYFVADQYGQANREFEKALSSSDTWHEPVIWDYLSLRGEGKDAAAKTLLEKNAKKTQRNDAQLRLVQYLEGQITEAALLDPPKEERKMGQCKVFFALGSEALIAGDKNKAREWFEKARGESDCSPYMDAATSARLKQVGVVSNP